MPQRHDQPSEPSSTESSSVDASTAQEVKRTRNLEQERIRSCPTCAWLDRVERGARNEINKHLRLYHPPQAPK